MNRSQMVAHLKDLKRSAKCALMVIQGGSPEVYGSIQTNIQYINENIEAIYQYVSVEERKVVARNVHPRFTIAK